MTHAVRPTRPARHNRNPKKHRAPLESDSCAKIHDETLHKILYENWKTDGSSGGGTVSSGVAVLGVSCVSVLAC